MDYNLFKKYVKKGNNDRKEMLLDLFSNEYIKVQEFINGTNIIIGDINTSKKALCAHYDTKIEGYGAYDNCGGVFSLLELYKKDYETKPLLIFTDKEEVEQSGAKNFLKKYGQELSNQIKEIIVIDCVGIGMNILGANYAKFSSDYRTDSHEFIDFGFNSTHLFTVDKKSKKELCGGQIPKYLASLMHTKEDSADKVSAESIENFVDTIYNYLIGGEPKWDNLENTILN